MVLNLNFKEICNVEGLVIQGRGQGNYLDGGMSRGNLMGNCQGKIFGAK
jgi:hypothetical protein